MPDRLNHDALRYVGGKLSPEMQMPKLLWIKRNFSATKWERIDGFFDLPDFLTWKATGDESRCDQKSITISEIWMVGGTSVIDAVSYRRLQ